MSHMMTIIQKMSKFVMKQEPKGSLVEKQNRMN